MKKSYIVFNAKTKIPFASGDSMEYMSKLLNIPISTFKYLSSTGNESKKYGVIIKAV